MASVKLALGPNGCARSPRPPASARIALVGPTAADVRDTMVEGESGLLSIAPNSNRPIYEPSKRRLTWPNGVRAAMFSSEEPERLRGPQHAAAWCDELASWRNVKADVGYVAVRPAVRQAPAAGDHDDAEADQAAPRAFEARRARHRHHQRSTYDNRDNLAATFFSQIVRQYEGTRLGRQELDAELLEDTPGALWTLELIEEGRRAKADIPPMRRIVVAIDPAVSVSEASDETGIIVAGLGTDSHGYVLEDASGKFSPIEWASRAVRLYRKWGADRIVAESNQGGMMVETTVRTVDPNASFKAVNASSAQNHPGRTDCGARRAASHSPRRRVSRIGRSALQLRGRIRRLAGPARRYGLGVHGTDARVRTEGSDRRADHHQTSGSVSGA